MLTHVPSYLDMIITTIRRKSVQIFFHIYDFADDMLYSFCTMCVYKLLYASYSASSIIDNEITQTNII